MCVPIYVVSEVFFVAFASSSIQEWNSSSNTNSPETPYSSEEEIVKQDEGENCEKNNPDENC